ncbi:MAG: hypothetical protein GF349_03270 [Candidatus Magasanikbacteria bacterium]|nr:hypothetical protein [Candidatus Magasanikbacteria bacterium]
MSQEHRKNTSENQNNFYLFVDYERIVRVFFHPRDITCAVMALFKISGVLNEKNDSEKLKKIEVEKGDPETIIIAVHFIKSVSIDEDNNETCMEIDE